jgi:hypothetical protein
MQAAESDHRLAPRCVGKQGWVLTFGGGVAAILQHACI